MSEGRGGRTGGRIERAIGIAIGGMIAVGAEAGDVQARPGPPPAPTRVDATSLARPSGTLYTVATAHLDTQWRWTIRETIESYLPATLRTNLAFFDTYPDYTFNFEGAFRYQLAGEYYPAEYEKMRRAIAAGRWRVAGSWVDAVDTNIPSPESLVRQVLYGNGFFRREFGAVSEDVFLPDCFGFGAALPAVAAHSGLLGFSSQKLTWGSAVGVPFDLGVWEGVDGSSLVAALNPGSYAADLAADLSADSAVCATVAKQGAASGAFAGVRYFGTGDTGGGPTEASVQWLERSLAGRGPVRVLSASSDQFARDLCAPGAEELRSRLPRYCGELLMTRHGAGCYTSQAAMKRMNRRNESLADAAERISLGAHLLGALPDPREALRENWIRFLWHQFHDDLTGTSIPEAYAFSWNDERIAENRLAAILGDAAGGVTRALDTRVAGVPIVVVNPLSIEREDVVEAWIPALPQNAAWSAGAEGPRDRSRAWRWPARGAGGGSTGLDLTGRAWPRDLDPAALEVRVLDPDGVETPAQLLEVSSEGIRIAFLARVPSVGFAVFDLQVSPRSQRSATRWGSPIPRRALRDSNAGLAASNRAGGAGLAVGTDVLANERFQVRLDADGNIASILDSAAGRELLRSPLQLQLIDDEPARWPAWEIDYEDLSAPPRFVVSGPARVRVLERGPARVALEVKRSAHGSEFVQVVRLAAGGAGDRVEVESRIDWRSPGTLLKAAFPLAVANERAAYDLGVGVMRRGINTAQMYEVPAQKWAALTSPGDSATTAVLNDCRYGWDHPDASTLRLTLLHTPRVNEGWRSMADQASQDLGRHTVTYAVCATSGAGHAAEIHWQAERLNRPLIALLAPAHRGSLGKRFSLAQVTAASVDGRASDVGRERSVRVSEDRKPGPAPGRSDPSFPTHGRTEPSPPVIIRALKLAEEDGAVIVRLQELSGAKARARLRLPWRVQSVREVNGAEEPFDPSLPSLSASRNADSPALDPVTGEVGVGFGPWQLRTLCLDLDRPADAVPPPRAAPCSLAFDLRGITVDNEAGGEFGPDGGAIPSEILPAVLDSEGIPFRTGPRLPGMANVMTCRGQRLDLPRGNWNRLYVLAASVGGDRRAEFLVDGWPQTAWVQDWSEPIGSWDDRLPDGKLVDDPARFTPAFVKPARLGWIGTHRHDSRGGNLAYAITPICRVRLDLPRGARTVTLPLDPAIRILAATAAHNENDRASLVTPLVDAAPATGVRIVTPTSGFLDSTRVRLASPDPTAVIRFTLDGTDPGLGSPVYQAPLRIDQSCTLKARAFRSGRDDRFVALREFRRLTPQPAVEPAGPRRQGLAYRYYEGDWDHLPDFDTLPAVRQGWTGDVGLPAGAGPDFFGVVLRGFLRVPTDGVYLFSLRSDDGSRLYLDGVLAVDSDGLHGLSDERGEVPLAAGLHHLRVEQFEKGGDEDLQLWIAGPGLALQPVPPGMLEVEEREIER